MLDANGLPVPCVSIQEEEDSSSPASRDSAKFDPAFVGADGKIDKTRLFDYVLADKSLAWNDLRTRTF